MSTSPDTDPAKVPFADVQRHDEPFRWFYCGSVFETDIARNLERWMRNWNRWTRPIEKNNRVTTFHFDQDEVPDALTDVLTPDVFAGLVAGMSELLGDELRPGVQVSLLKQGHGDGSLIHTDYFGEGVDRTHFFTHRLITYLTLPEHEVTGGALGIFDDDAAGTAPVETIIPTFNTGVGMAMGPRSFHAVSRIETGERLALNFSFLHASGDYPRA